MQRKIIQSLEKWKYKINRKPLIIQGARQVGKTWAMKHFGEQSFEKVAYINFDNNPRMKTLFSGDYDIERLILGLKIESGVDIQAENTLIIFEKYKKSRKHYHHSNIFTKMHLSFISSRQAHCLGVTTSSSLFSCWQSGFSTTLSHGFSRIFNRTWQTRFGEIAGIKRLVANFSHENHLY